MKILTNRFSVILWLVCAAAAYGQDAGVADTAAATKIIPPFKGNYRVLISRPTYAAYDSKTSSKWVSAVAELYTYYKVSAFPRTHVFTMEQVNGVMPSGWRDPNRTFNRSHFVEAARKLGATHVIYQEYLPEAKGNRTQFTMELYRVAEEALVVKAFDTVKFADFEGGLGKCLSVIAKAMDSAAANTEAFKRQLFPRDRKFLEMFGSVLADEGVPADAAAAAGSADAAVERAVSTYSLAKKHIDKYGDHAGVQYAAAQLAARAGDYARALEHINAVTSGPGNYPALHLQKASYLRKAGHYSDALKSATAAWSNPAIKTPAVLEMAAVYKAQGDTARAREAYNHILQSGGKADASVYFEFAFMEAQGGHFDDSEAQIAAASRRKLTFTSDEYYALGLAFGKDPSRADRAVSLITESMGANLNDARAWAAIADIHSRAGNKKLRADALVNLFKIDPREENIGHIKTAGGIYYEIGDTEKAKDAYNLALKRNYFDVSVTLGLARIYLAERDCEKLPNIIRWIDTIPEAAEMLAACGFKVVDEAQTVRAKKTPRLLIAARLSTGALAAGALAGGLYFNGKAAEEWKRYRNFAAEGAPHLKTPAENYGSVQDMRENIDESVFQRDLLYFMAILGAAGLSVTLFF